MTTNEERKKAHQIIEHIRSRGLNFDHHQLEEDPSAVLNSYQVHLEELTMNTARLILQRLWWSARTATYNQIAKHVEAWEERFIGLNDTGIAWQNTPLKREVSVNVIQR